MQEVPGDRLVDRLRALLSRRPLLLAALNRLSPEEIDAGISVMLASFEQHSSPSSVPIIFDLPDSLEELTAPRSKQAPVEEKALDLRPPLTAPVTEPNHTILVPGHLPGEQMSEPVSGEDEIVELSEHELLYLFGLALRPEGTTHLIHPVSVDVAGIQDQTSIAALDIEQFRIYVCTISPERMSVSGAGTLLLSKQESLHLRGIHERALNELRSRSLLLPFEFGHAFHGQAALELALQDHTDDLQESLERLSETGEWRITVFVLDARIRQLIGPEPSARRRERLGTGVRRRGAARERTDVKTLERLLFRERRIAETILTDVRKLGYTCDVAALIGMTAGSSHDWKRILEVRVQVPEGDRRSFFEAIAELQTTHQIFQPMIRVAGAVDRFSLRKQGSSS